MIIVLSRVLKLIDFKPKLAQIFVLVLVSIRIIQVINDYNEYSLMLINLSICENSILSYVTLYLYNLYEYFTLLC